MVAPHELVGSWRSEADRLEAWRAQVQAATLRRAADELEAALRAAADDVLTLAEASEVSGYSAAHLERLVRDGRIPNAGRKHAPRICRRDLPQKPGTLPREPRIRSLADARRQAVRAIVGSEGATDGMSHR